MKFENIRVAITGSGGFIGAPLVKKLKAQGAKIIPIDHKHGLDVLKFEEINQVVGGFDVLVHLAAKTFVPESYENPRDFYFANLIGTLNALELCRLRRARMIFASSYVYGVPQFFPIDESHPVEGFNPYAGSKIAGEQLCQRYHSDHGLDVTIFRVFNVYGPGQDKKFLIPTIIGQAKTGEVVLRDPKPKRDFVYIDDVVDAYLKGIKACQGALNIINIASGISFSVEEIVAEVLGNFSGTVKVKYTGEERPSEVKDTRASISRAKKILGWSPGVSFSEGIKRCVEAELRG